MKIPKYEDIIHDIDQAGEDSITPLEKFMLNHEPAGQIAEQQFRSELQAAVDYVLEHHCPLNFGKVIGRKSA